MLTPVMLHSFPRSGSTLVMMILSCVDGVQFSKVYPFEERDLTYTLRLVNAATHPIDKERRGELLNWFARDIHGYPYEPVCDFFADTEEARRELFRRIWAGYSDSLRAKHDCEYYAEKSAFGVAEQVNSYISSRNILLSRDPRGVFNSIVKFDAKRGYHAFGRQEGESLLSYAGNFCNHQRGFLRWLASFQDGDNVLRISYETLIQNFQASLQQFEGFLQRPLDQERLQQEVSAYLWHTTSETAGSSVDEWRKDLDEEVIALINESLAEEMAMLGYS